MLFTHYLSSVFVMGFLTGPSLATSARVVDTSSVISNSLTPKTAPKPLFRRSIPATNGLYDPASAYEEPTGWDYVVNLTLQTFDTDEHTFDDMYYDEKELPKIKIGVCLNATDYPDPLTEPCGEINVRGASSRSAVLKSLKVKLDKDAPFGKWRGRRHIVLVKSPWDFSRIRNAVAYELLSTIDGMISVATGFVHLFMNGEDYGLYHVVERLDDNYLVNHGLGETDYLLKADDFEWDAPKAGFIPNVDVPLEEEWLDCKNAPEDPSTGEFSTDWYDEMAMLVEKLRVAYEDENCTAAEEFFSEHIDIESLITTMAVNAIFLESDAVNHNFLLYKPVDGTKWSHTPWDRDVSFDFWRQAHQETYFLAEDFQNTYQKGVLFQYFSTWNILFKVYFRAEGNVDRIVTRMEKLTAEDGPLSGEKITRAMRKYAAIVKDYVGLGKDNQIPMDLWQPEIDRMLEVYSDPLKTVYEFETELDTIRAAEFCPAWSI